MASLRQKGDVAALVRLRKVRTRTDLRHYVAIATKRILIISERPVCRIIGRWTISGQRLESIQSVALNESLGHALCAGRKDGVRVVAFGGNYTRR